MLTLRSGLQVLWVDIFDIFDMIGTRYIFKGLIAAVAAELGMVAVGDPASLGVLVGRLCEGRDILDMLPGRGLVVGDVGCFAGPDGHFGIWFCSVAGDGD